MNHAAVRPQTSWPLPDQVAGYGDKTTFERSRKESGQWVFWQDRVDLVLAGRYDDVLPLHVELSPTYLCNFACPWCSCRSAREEWSETDVFNHPRSSPKTVMREERLTQVLTHLGEHGVGIMWVGGEPTMNPLLYPAALRANDLGLAQCLFTNGSLVNAKRVEALFDANLVFIRVSLNAVSSDIHQRHHDYDPRKGYADRVLTNLDQLAHTRSTRRSQTLLGVSVVVDENNVGDLEPTARLLCELTERHGRGAVDYVIFRPAFPFDGAQIDMRTDTAAKFTAAVGTGSPWHNRMVAAGIDVVIPDASVAPTADPPKAASANDGLGCLAAGWFGEVTPAGDMVACSDRYGNPDYFIGNVAERSISRIWASTDRAAVLERARATNCFGTYCPRNGRGHHLNRTFRQVEQLRGQGRIEDVRTWIDNLQAVLPRPTHSFFL